MDSLLPWWQDWKAGTAWGTNYVTYKWKQLSLTVPEALMWRSESWPGFGTSAMLPGLRSEALWLSFWLEGHGHCWLSLGMTEVTFSSPQPTPPVPGHCPSPGSGPQLWCSFLPPPWVHPPRWATSSSQSSGLTRHSPMVNPSMGALNLRLTLSSRLAQIAHHCLSRTWLSLSFLMLAFKKKLIKLFPLFHIFLSLYLWNVHVLFLCF